MAKSTTSLAPLISKVAKRAKPANETFEKIDDPKSARDAIKKGYRTGGTDLRTGQARPKKP